MLANICNVCLFWNKRKALNSPDEQKYPAPRIYRLVRPLTEKTKRRDNVWIRVVSSERRKSKEQRAKSKESRHKFKVTGWRLLAAGLPREIRRQEKISAGLRVTGSKFTLWNESETQCFALFHWVKVSVVWVNSLRLKAHSSWLGVKSYGFHVSGYGFTPWNSTTGENFCGVAGFRLQGSGCKLQVCACLNNVDRFLTLIKFKVEAIRADSLKLAARSSQLETKRRENVWVELVSKE